MSEEYLEVGRVVPNAPEGVQLSNTHPPQRKRLVHTTPDWVPVGEVFFVTICCSPRGANQLAAERPFALVNESFAHYAARQMVWPHLVLAMPDHLHGLMSFPRTEQMAKVISDWKRYITRHAKITWQDGFFDHRLRNTESFDEEAGYILANPVRAGLVASSDEWPYTWPTAAAKPAG